MKIRDVIALSIASMIGFSAIIGGIVVFASQQAERVVAQSTQAEAVLSEVFAMNGLVQEYVLFHEERPKAQWRLRSERIHVLLASPALRDEPSRGYVAGLRDQMRDIGASFDELVVATEAAPDPALSRQLASGILVQTQHLLSDLSEVSRRAVAWRTEARRRTDLLTFAMLAVLAAATSVVLLVLYRRIGRSIIRLQKGTEIIGGGDLEHAVAMDSDDEIGLLSRSFDAMALQLKRMRDTLEQRVKERTSELEVLSRKNEILLQSIGDGVVAIDAAWTIVLWNDAATRITGYPREEAVGRPLRSVLRFIREHDRSENLRFIAEAMMRGKPMTMENHTVLIRKDGSEIPVGDSAAPIIDMSTGRSTGAIIVFRDASEERDSRLLRTSFAYASHQLRTPVNRALWGLEALLEEKMPAKVKVRVTESLAYLKSVNKMVGALVEVSEIEQGSVIPKFAPTDLADVLEEALASLAKDTDRNGTQLNISPPPKERLLTDARLLTRALHEVVHNAVLYSRKGGEVSIDFAVTDGQLLITVKDHGIGILPEQVGIVFTKFFRGLNVPPQSVGAGLGLYMARLYLTMLKGKIWFVSGEEGTVFTLALPIGD